MNKKKILPILYYVVLTATLMYFSLQDGVSANHLILMVSIIIIMVLIALFINTIIHEVGHLIGGLLSGYRFSSFRIFNIMIMKSNGKMVLRKFSLPNTGGQCLMDPPELIDGNMKYTLYNLAGSLFSIISGGVFLALAYSSIDEVFLEVFLKILGYMAIVLGLYNIIPLKTGVIYNDGMHLVILNKEPQAVFALWLQLKISKLQCEGVRLKDFNSEWFFMPEKEELKNPLISSIGVFYVNKLIDEENFVEAYKIVDELLHEDVKLIPFYKKLLELDKIFLELMNGNNEIINTLYNDELKAFSKSIQNLPSRIRTEYAIALLHEKNETKAKKLLAQFKKISKSHPYTGDIEGEKELIDIITELSKK